MGFDKHKLDIVWTEPALFEKLRQFDFHMTESETRMLARLTAIDRYN